MGMPLIAWRMIRLIPYVMAGAALWMVSPQSFSTPHLASAVALLAVAFVLHGEFAEMELESEYEDAEDEPATVVVNIDGIEVARRVANPFGSEVSR